VELTAQTQRQVIAFAGGEDKHKAIAAALRGRWVTGLITDEASARYALSRGD
jgi:DNA-binding transcriptional regulator LsrR (DeoR family)